MTWGCPASCVDSAVRYCAECGPGLGEPEVGGTRRPACAAWGPVVFQYPKLAVAVPTEGDVRLVMGRPALNSVAAARWSFPAGFVERREPVEDAAPRDVRDENGLEVRLGRLLGLYSTDGDPVVLAVYPVTAVTGTLAPADDLTELAFFPTDALPDPAFPHDPQIVADWLAWRLTSG